MIGPEETHVANSREVPGIALDGDAMIDGKTVGDCWLLLQDSWYSMPYFYALKREIKM